MGTITKYKQNRADCVLTHYGSIAEMEADCLQSPMLRVANVKQLNDDILAGRHGQSWYGVPDLATVKRVIREGYPEGAALVDTLYDKIAAKLPRAVEFRRRRVRGDQGDELDIHAVNRGALDKAWTATRRRPNHGSGLIRIAVDICGNAHVGADQLRWRGVAALALSRAMTKAGYSVEIVAGQSGSRAFRQRTSSDPLAPTYGTITVTVKPRYAVIDTATLAASVCLPGFFRFLGFASIVKQADDAGYDVCSSLGSAAKLETLLPVPEKVAQVVVPETVNTADAAEKWVMEALAMLQGATVGKEAA